MGTLRSPKSSRTYFKDPHGPYKASKGLTRRFRGDFGLLGVVVDVDVVGVVVVDVDVADVLQAFKKDLSAGVRKTCVEAEQLMARLKHFEDYEAIKNLPRIQDMQKTLKTAYMHFKIIAKKYAGQPSLPKSVWNEGAA